MLATKSGIGEGSLEPLQYDDIKQNGKIIKTFIVTDILYQCLKHSYVENQMICGLYTHSMKLFYAILLPTISSSEEFADPKSTER